MSTTTTADAIIANAFVVLNVFMPGESVPGPQASFALSRLNNMMGQWAQNSLTIPAVVRSVFDLVANQGGPSNPYFIGTGAQFNTPRPPNQKNLVAASLLLTSSTPNTEIPLAVYTDDGYNAIQQKELTSAQPTGVYYNPITNSSTGYGSIELYPVPTTATNDLVLYLQQPLAAFADLTTSYIFADGYQEALEYNLAKRLAGPFGRTLTDDDRLIATNGLAMMERANTKLSDLAVDPMFLGHGFPYGYNIYTNNI